MKAADRKAFWRAQEYLQNPSVLSFARIGELSAAANIPNQVRSQLGPRLGHAKTFSGLCGHYDADPCSISC